MKARKNTKCALSIIRPEITQAWALITKIPGAEKTHLSIILQIKVALKTYLHTIILPITRARDNQTTWRINSIKGKFLQTLQSTHSDLTHKQYKMIGLLSVVEYQTTELVAESS